MGSTSNQDRCTYVKFHLTTEDLTPRSREFLEVLGVECLDSGGAFEAYGITDGNEAMLKALGRVPGVSDVSFESPPCCK